MTARADELEEFGRRSDNPDVGRFRSAVGAILARVCDRLADLYWKRQLSSSTSAIYLPTICRCGVQSGGIAMGKSKPSGPHAAEMTGPGAWPETDEDVFTDRANELSGILSKVDAALSTWQGHQATIFNGVHVWSGDASKAAGAAVDGATKAMQDHAAATSRCDRLVQERSQQHRGREGHYHVQCHRGSTGNPVDRENGCKKQSES